MLVPTLSVPARLELHHTVRPRRPGRVGGCLSAEFEYERFTPAQAPTSHHRPRRLHHRTSCSSIAARASRAAALRRHLTRVCGVVEDESGSPYAGGHLRLLLLRCTRRQRRGDVRASESFCTSHASPSFVTAIDIANNASAPRPSHWLPPAWDQAPRSTQAHLTRCGPTPIRLPFDAPTLYAASPSRSVCVDAASAATQLLTPALALAPRRAQRQR